MPRTLRDGAVPGAGRHIPAGRPVRVRRVAAALPQRHRQVLSAGRHRAVPAGAPVPGAAGQRRHQGRVHMQGGPRQVVWRRRVLPAVHARPVRRGQHVQREHDGHGHGGRLRGRAVHRGQAVLPGRQGLSPGGHAGPVSRGPDRAVPGHCENVHRGRVVSGHVRVREQRGRARGRAHGVVLLVVAVRGRWQRARVDVQTAIAAGVGAQAPAAAATATAATGRGVGRPRPPGAATGLGASAPATGPVRPPARRDRVDRPVVQAAVHAGPLRAGRVGGAGPGQGHEAWPWLEDGQVRVPARVHGRAGAVGGRQRRRQRDDRVPAARGHVGQVPQHQRGVQPERDQERGGRRRQRREDAAAHLNRGESSCAARRPLVVTGRRLSCGPDDEALVPES